ncbi:MAG: hypothetical protein WD768_23210 [Phycisphaeraceae bacterium]
MLYEADRAVAGRFIPAWTLPATGTEARAAALCEVNWWFELAFVEQRKREEVTGVNFRRRARARVYDDDGYQWLVMSVRRLAERIMTPKSTANDALADLESKGLITITQGDAGKDSLAIRPCARPLAEAFFKATDDPTAYSEYLDPSTAEVSPGWTDSRTQAAAFHTSNGTTVHDLLVAALDGDLWLARLLSQILWYFGDRLGKCRAKIIMNGHLWLAKSHAALSREMSKSLESVRRGLDALVEEYGVLARCIAPYRPNAQWEHSSTTHLRPNLPVLLERVKHHLPDEA